MNWYLGGGGIPFREVIVLPVIDSSLKITMEICYFPLENFILLY